VVVSRHPQKALYAYLRCFTGLVPSGLTPSSVLECGLINRRDGVVTYVLRAVAREKTTRVMNRNRRHQN
jgi:hypothetical protein